MRVAVCDFGKNEYENKGAGSNLRRNNCMLDRVDLRSRLMTSGAQYLLIKHRTMYGKNEPLTKHVPVHYCDLNLQRSAHHCHCKRIGFRVFPRLRSRLDVVPSRFAEAADSTRDWVNIGRLNLHCMVLLPILSFTRSATLAVNSAEIITFAGFKSRCISGSPRTPLWRYSRQSATPCMMR